MNAIRASRATASLTIGVSGIFWRLWNFSLEGLTSFTIAPLKIAMYVGIFTAACAALYGTGIIVGTLVWGNPVAGYPSLLVVMLFLGGLQLTTLGIIGESLGRVFNEAKQRPLYFVREYWPCRQQSLSGRQYQTTRQLPKEADPENRTKG
jgi:hypothetical protein